MDKILTCKTPKNIRTGRTKASKKVNGAYVPTALAGGFDGTAVTDADRIRALNTLKSTKDYTFQLIII